MYKLQQLVAIEECDMFYVYALYIRKGGPKGLDLPYSLGNKASPIQCSSCEDKVIDMYIQHGNIKKKVQGAHFFSSLFLKRFLICALVTPLQSVPLLFGHVVAIYSARCSQLPPLIMVYLHLCCVDS